MAALERTIRKDKNQNIQVFVRLRPLNQREKAIRSLGVVEVINPREVVVRQSHQSSHTKKFTFDRAFGPNAEQVEVYKEVVSPLIAEVLAGYNCTVFAYGQTGTGKTHTMAGENSGEGTTWQNDPLAGMIPRALSHLFDELRITKAEYTVRVSYLELYNEELFDLLSSSEDNSKLRIYEDVTRKGSTIVNGLEEITVYTKNEVYDIMAQGQERKKVASTLMNAQSSRSHTVFTIVVHMKENNCTKGEELVKIGKLNLVDLAGSENISKAGSDNPTKRERARECVNINQSLLTLGRVITALVEKHPHIPYRESKLTRILQESLGGRTKTSIIATISPGHKDLEETMSTLEYAHRARNIQNKPEINQKLTKQAILKDFAEEIDKLKRELTASREKNGVYLPSDTYVELTLKQEQLRLEIQELLLKKRAMEEERARMEQVFEELNREHQRTVDTLTDTNHRLQHTESKLADTVQQCHEQEHLAEVRAHTERQLTAQAQQLLAAAELQASDLRRLHDTVERRRSVESNNQNVVSSYRDESSAHRENILRGVRECTEEFAGLRDHMQADIDDYARDASMTQETNIQDMKVLITKLEMFMNEIKSMTESSAQAITDSAADCHNKITEVTSNRRQKLQEVVYQLVQSVAASVQRAAEVDASRTVARAAEQWLKDASARVQCLERTQCSFQNNLSSAATRRGENVRAAHRERLTRLHQRQENIQEALQELEKGNKEIEARITKQQTLIESEREHTETRLQNWMEEERRSLEERMARYVAMERDVLNSRIEQYTTELEQNKKSLAENTEKCVQLRQLQLQGLEEEKDIEDANLESRERETQQCSKIAGEFDKDFGEGVSAISAEMCAFGDSVVRVVDHCVTELRTELNNAHQHAQEGGTAILETDHQTTEECSAVTGSAVAGVVSGACQGMTGVVEKATEASTSAANTLQELTARTSTLASTSLNHQSTLTSQLSTAVQCVEQLGNGVRSTLEEHANAEGRYLMQEYRVYAPSGDTPARRNVQYPRQLVATSPRDRILARLRAAGPMERNHTASPDTDSDCVLVESYEGRRDGGTSDSDTSESSVSEDSAVAMSQ